jgi:hypothetical protein
LFIVISVVDSWLENLYFLFRYQGTIQSPNEFFRLPRKHAAADHLDPSRLLLRPVSPKLWFNEHAAKLLRINLVVVDHIGRQVL